MQHSGGNMSIQVRCFTEEEWLRMVQHMSRKELIALVIEQQKEKERLVYEKNILLQDVASARRKLGEQWIPTWSKYK